MGRYRWQSCSRHLANEWASFGRYRMRMVHGMDYILLHFHKFFLFLTTQSSGQKNENKVPGCVQLWLGHAEIILEPWETNMLWISEVLLFLATYLWVKKNVLFVSYGDRDCFTGLRQVGQEQRHSESTSFPFTFFLWKNWYSTCISLIRYRADGVSIWHKAYKNQCADFFHPTHAGNANSSGFVSKYTWQPRGIMTASAKNTTKPMIPPSNARFQITVNRKRRNSSRWRNTQQMKYLNMFNYFCPRRAINGCIQREEDRGEVVCKDAEYNWHSRIPPRSSVITPERPSQWPQKKALEKLETMSE